MIPPLLTHLITGSVAMPLLTLSSLSAQEPALPNLYEDQKDQFVVALPTDWTAYDQNAVVFERHGPYGMIVFAAVDLAHVPAAEQPRALHKVDTGEKPSFFVDRHRAPKKTSCHDFPKKAQEDAVKLVKPRHKGLTELEPFHSDSVTVGGCQGVRIRGRVRYPDGDEWVTDVHAVSDGQAMYLFSVRHQAKYYEQSLGPYEESMATLQLTHAQ